MDQVYTDEWLDSLEGGSVAVTDISTELVTLGIPRLGKNRGIVSDGFIHRKRRS